MAYTQERERRVEPSTLGQPWRELEALAAASAEEVDFTGVDSMAAAFTAAASVVVVSTAAVAASAAATDAKAV